MVLAIWVFVIVDAAICVAVILAFAILAAVIVAFNNFEAFIFAVAEILASTNNAAVGIPVVAEWTKHMFEFAGTANNLAIDIVLLFILLFDSSDAVGTPEALYV